MPYQFNADGQMIQRGLDTYQYSAQGELLQATVGGQTITYAYDGTGRRVARTDSTGTYQYLYGDLKNPFQLAAMRDPAGVLSTFYYDDAGLLFAMDKGSTRYYIATDQVGTPKVVSDNTGAVVKTMTFDSFGFPTYDSNPGVTLPVGFAGGLTDTNTGLVRFGYRDYEPATGRWTAKDPIFFKGGLNLYGYALNNPITLRDPSGLHTIFDGHGRPIPHTHNKKGVCELATPIPGDIQGMGEYMKDFVKDAASYVAGALTALATESVTLGGMVQEGLSSFFNALEGNPPNIPEVPVDLSNPSEAY